MEFRFGETIRSIMGTPRPRKVIQMEINQLTNEYELKKVEYRKAADNESERKKLQKELKDLKHRREILIEERDRD
jgi:hypothetical protein